MQLKSKICNSTFVSHQMASLFTIEECNAIVQSDINPNLNQYSQEIQPTIQNYWSEIQTDYVILPALLTNSIRFRIANGSPNVVNYSPHLLGHHPSLLTYLRSIFYNFLRFECFKINFSFSLMIQDSEGIRFLYSSNNFQALETAHIIHNNSSKQNFLEIINGFNLSEYIKNTKKNLSEKYDDIDITCLSVFFSITRLNDRVYGLRKGLTSLTKCCPTDLPKLSQTQPPKLNPQQDPNSTRPKLNQIQPKSTKAKAI